MATKNINILVSNQNDINNYSTKILSQGGYGNTQIYSNSTYSTISVLNNLLRYYKFETSDITGTTSLADYSTGSVVYNGTLSVSGIVNTNNYKIGGSSLNLTGTQSVNIGNIPAQGANGISFSSWVYGNNTPSYSTIFDIGKGKGVDNISMGLVGNTISTFVLNGNINSGTAAFSSQSYPFGSTTTTSVTGGNQTLPIYSFPSITANGKRMYILAGAAILYTDLTIISDTSLNYTNFTPISFSTSVNNARCVKITNDGTRGVVTVPNQGFYFFTYNGTTHSQLTAIDTGASTYYMHAAFNANGSRVVYSVFNNQIYYSDWNGTSYGSKVQITSNSREYGGITLTKDSSIVFYSVQNTSTLFYMRWNGTSYTGETALNSLCNRALSLTLNDSVLLQSNNGVNLYYSVWNPITNMFNTTPTAISTTYMPIGDQWYLDSLPDGNIFLGIAGGTIYRSRISLSNLLTSYNSTSINLNNASWNHVTWTISNSGTYNLYINGNLTTTTNSNIVVRNVSRGNSYIGKSNYYNTYFNGSIDDFRIYSKVLTQNEITDLSNNTTTLTPVLVTGLLQQNKSGLLYNGSYYLIGGNSVITSPDVVSWSSTGTAITGMTAINNFAWNNPSVGTPIIQPLTIACGEGSNTLGYSPDGIYWKGLGSDVFNPRANKVIWNGVLWTAVGTGPYWVATSYDGISWTGRDSSLLTEAYDIAWNGSIFIATGYGGITPLVSSRDGINWYNIPSSANIFTTYASSIVWTSKVWIAYGSGTNTTAISTSPDGWIWNPTSVPNLAVTDANSCFKYSGYPQSDTSMATSSTYTATYLPYKAMDNNMTSASSTEWRSSAGTYNSSTGINTGISTATTYNSALTASGEWLQITPPSGFVLKYYHISFFVDVSGSYYNIPKEWYLLGSSNGTTWNLLDYNNMSYSAISPNTYNYPFIVKFRNLFSNTINYNYYRIVIPSIFSGGSTTYTRISECDLYYENQNTRTLDSHIKPIVTKTHVLHPTTIVPFSTTTKKQVIYQITDLYGNLISNSSSINNGFYNNNIIAGLNGSPPSSYVFDGQNLLVSSISGNINYINNNSINTNLNFDISMNSSMFSSNINGNIYTSCFNGKQIIFGGKGGNVITYCPPLSTGATTSLYSSLNANQIFTSVNGLASNNDYGFVCSPNRIYFNPGEKISVVAPRAYNKNISNMNTFNIGLNTSNLIQKVVLPSAGFLFTVFGHAGPTGPVGIDGIGGPIGYSGPAGCVGKTGPVGIIGVLGPLGADPGASGCTGAPGIIGYTGTIDTQLWNYTDNSKRSIYTSGNVQIGTSDATQTIDISGNLNITGTIHSTIARFSNIVSINNNLSIGKQYNSTTTNVLDVSGNVIFNNSMIINNPITVHSTQNSYVLDISGTTRIKTLFANKIYNYISIPTLLNSGNITVDYKSGDIFYIDAGSTFTENFYCIIENLPLSSIPFSSITITILLDYINTPLDRYYCDRLQIGGNMYNPNFNGGNPVAISEFNSSTNTYIITYKYIQKFSIIVVNGTIWKVFCDSDKYSS